MGVIPYWRERLKDHHPLALEALRVEGYNVRKRTDIESTWPRAVAKQALLADYKAWYDRVFLPPFLDTGFYQDCPDQLPKRPNEFEFFATLSPFIHIVGRAQQTRAYHVPEQRQHQGEWVTVKVHRNFVRLCEWDEHAATFELLTGFRVYETPLDLQRNHANMHTVAQGVKVNIRQIAANRQAMAIGKTRKVDDA